MIFVGLMALVASCVALYALLKWRSVSKYVVRLVLSNQALKDELADKSRKAVFQERMLSDLSDKVKALEHEITHLPRRGSHGHFERR